MLSGWAMSGWTMSPPAPSSQRRPRVQGPRRPWIGWLIANRSLCSYSLEDAGVFDALKMRWENYHALFATTICTIGNMLRSAGLAVRVAYDPVDTDVAEVSPIGGPPDQSHAELRRKFVAHGRGAVARDHRGNSVVRRLHHHLS